MKNFCLNWAHCAFPPHPSPLLTPLPSSEFLINIIPLGKLWLKMKWCKVLQSLEKLELLELIVCSVLIYYFFFTHFCIKLILEVPLKKLLRLSAFFFSFRLSIHLSLFYSVSVKKLSSSVAGQASLACVWELWRYLLLYCLALEHSLLFLWNLLTDIKVLER